MDKRTLLAFALIAVVYLVSSKFIWQNKSEAQIEATKTEQVQEIEQKETYSSEKIDESKIAEIINNSDIQLDNKIVIENEQLKLTFSNLGGELVQAEIKEYLNPEKTGNVLLIPENKKALSLELFTESGVKNTSEVLFAHQVFSNENVSGVKFFLKNENDVVLEKKFTLKENYEVLFDFSMKNYAAVNGYVLNLDQGINDTEFKLSRKEQAYKIVSQIDNDLESSYASRLKPSKTYEGNITWAASRTKYFLFGVIPEQRINMNKLKALNVDDAPGMKLFVENDYAYNELEDHFQIYIGPSIPSIMEKIGYGFENAAELGMKWIRPISKIFIWFLGFLYSLIPNYGVCLIILAICLKLVLWPLTHKTYESSQKMQKAQPYIQEIQRKYKEDPKQMQLELGKVYKEHGVNPFGGCLPLFLQMPIFFSLYPAIKDSINLRQASFAFWLQDLSSPDPYYVLPILMGIFMFLQQKLMSPQKNVPTEEMDEKQQAAAQSQKMMMYIMPVMMAFIFSKLPSGLVLYWTFFNILSIVQQYQIKQHFKNA